MATSKTVLKQAGRNGVLTTPLPRTDESDPLALTHFDGSEGLSELFNFNIEAVSLNPAIDADQLMGQAVTVSIRTLKETPGSQTPEFHDRIFNGIVTAVRSLGLTQHEFFGYRLTVRPWLWLLTRTSNCRIFQDKDVPTIIQKVFEENGFSDFELKLDGNFPKLDYCVQYRETDFNFISRLMEKEGIYYYFRHQPVPPGQPSKHVLVLANGKSSHLPVPDHKETAFSIVEEHAVGTREVITNWSNIRQMRSGVYEYRDYNYETPNADMKGHKSGNEKYRHADKELYDYPGNYKDADAGNRYAQIAFEAEQTPDHRRYGTGYAISLFPGGLTTLKQLPLKNDSPESRKRIPTPDEFQEYLIVRALHIYGTQDYRAAGDSSLIEGFSGSYEFQPSSQPFRAPIVTPRPRIYGIQTAKVVTKDKGSSEEIDVEKLSEIYVHFYWDRNRQKEDKEQRSVKLRCAQLWAGKKWGGQFIPRVGMEVVVEFLEGDPDRPIVTGCVYNDDNQPPYDLPSKKTISGIKSDSTKGGHGYNEWNFEDKKGSEQINVHAQKDLNVHVLNNETRDIDNDLTTTIKHAEKRTIGEQFLPPKGSPSRDITLQMGDDNLTIMMGDQTVSIPLGQQTTTALLSIMNTVIASNTQITPAMISLLSPLIDMTAMGMINMTAPALNITAPLVNITGAVNITGPVLINGMVPVTIPA